MNVFQDSKIQNLASKCPITGEVVRPTMILLQKIGLTHRYSRLVYINAVL